MASTTLVRDALWRASVLLNDSGPQFVRYTEKEMVNALNDGQMAIFKFLPVAGSRVDAVRLVPGTRQSIESIPAAYCKPGDGSTPSAPILGTQLLDIIRNMGADGLTPGAPVRPVTREVLDTTARSWHSTASTAVASFVHNPQAPRYFWTYPGAHASTPVWVEMAYTAQPAKIPNTGTPGAELYAVGGSSTVLLGVTDDMLDELVHYVVARCLMKAGEGSDPGRAAVFVQLFTSGLNSKAQALTGNNPNLKLLPFAPEPAGVAT